MMNLDSANANPEESPQRLGSQDQNSITGLVSVF